MKKLLSMILSLSTLFTLLISACAVQVAEAGTDGTTLSQEEFTRYFAGESADEPQVATVSSSPKLAFNSITYDLETHSLYISGRVTDSQGGVKAIQLDGTLYNSYQKQNGINSTVAILDDLQANFDVLYFNLFDSTESSTFQFDPTKQGVPHLKVYLMDRNTKELYFFELDIPETLENVSIPLTQETICPDMLHDMIWFANVVEAETSFIPADENSIATYSVGVKNLGKFTLKWDGVGGPYYYFTTPIIRYSINNIQTSAEWSFRFALSDGYCIVDGSRYDLKGIDIDGLQFSMGLGSNTVIQSPVISSTCRVLTGNGGSTNPSQGGTTTTSTISGLLATLATTTINAPDAGLAVINALINLTSSNCTIGTDIVFGNESLRGFSVRYSDSRYRIRNNYDDSMEHIGFVFTAQKYGNATGSRNCNTMVKFHAHCGATQFQSDEIYSSYDYMLTN